MGHVTPVSNQILQKPALTLPTALPLDRGSTKNETSVQPNELHVQSPSDTRQLLAELSAGLAGCSASSRLGHPALRTVGRPVGPFHAVSYYRQSEFCTGSVTSGGIGLALIVFLLTMTDYLWVSYCVRPLIRNRTRVAHDPSLCHDTVLHTFEITMKSEVVVFSKNKFHLKKSPI